MNNVAITSSESVVKVEFNDYAASIGFSCQIVHKSIVSIALSDDSSFIEFNMGKWWLRISFQTGIGLLVVDSVNGSAPTDNVDLLNKLAEII